MEHQLTLAITPVYAAVLALFFLHLSMRVGKMRQVKRISIGSAGDAELERAARVQGNCAEYMPIAILLFAFAEMMGAQGWLVHGLNLAFLIGRLAHYHGTKSADTPMKFRFTGMMLTFAAIATGAVTILVLGA
ncbi:MAG: glutathione metabolism protein [Rhodospirillaceae bacterium]|jgi:hypothetical protein|nr:glutathione metabolism protein [Rhodospirillaceae bacterium]MBT5374961.1 glutathione metabolism protein [Rhodospirillaceae bacterium]MBT5751825.1 glutathione metabolism protein [Rhodospirillaceae bacterium]